MPDFYGWQYTPFLSKPTGAMPSVFKTFTMIETMKGGAGDSTGNSVLD